MAEQKLDFMSLSSEINATSIEEYEEQFRALLKEDFAQVEEIVYVFTTRDAIPRENGDSHILYIGQTKYSFKYRYYKQDPINRELGLYKSIYADILKNYGPIHIGIIQTSDHVSLESEMLLKYKAEFGELPPANKRL